MENEKTRYLIKMTNDEYLNLYLKEEDVWHAHTTKDVLVATPFSLKEAEVLTSVIKKRGNLPRTKNDQDVITLHLAEGLRPTSYVPLLIRLGDEQFV